METKDGTAKFRLRDARLNSLLDILYPIGSIKITVNTEAPFKDLAFGTWKEVGSGKVLWGADTHKAGETIEAGLPNITGNVSSTYNWEGAQSSGAFRTTKIHVNELVGAATQKNNIWHVSFPFNASWSNAIYGKSSTVQPPAYVVHFWQRVS